MDAVSPIRFVEQFHLLFLVQLSRRVDKPLFVAQGRLQPPLLPPEHPLLRGHGPRPGRRRRPRVPGQGERGPRVAARSPRSSRPGRIASTTCPSRSRPTRRNAGSSGCASRAPPSPLPTKIECSRRGLDDGVAFGSVDAHARARLPAAAAHGEPLRRARPRCDRRSVRSPDVAKRRRATCSTCTTCSRAVRRGGAVADARPATWPSGRAPTR